MANNAIATRRRGAGTNKVWPEHRVVRTLVKTASRAARADDTFHNYRAGGELEAQGLEDFEDIVRD